MYTFKLRERNLILDIDRDCSEIHRALFTSDLDKFAPASGSTRNNRGIQIAICIIA